MNYLVDLTLKVICVPLFSLLVENAHISEMLTLVNSVLFSRRLAVPKTVPELLNKKFGAVFDRVIFVVRSIVHNVELSEVPQLQYLEPRYADFIEGPSPRCISSLLYSNTVNIELTSNLLKICDTCVSPLEMVSCNIVIIPSGCRLKPHKSEYCGVLTYLLAVEGSTLCHLQVGPTSLTLNSKASMLYDPFQETSLQHTGPTNCVLLKIELYRPFELGFDSVNWSALQVMSESYEVQQACNLANMST
jgi:hypothetical protein